MKSVCAALAFAALLVSLITCAGAAEDATVSSHLKEGYEIVGIIPSSAGPGIFLKRGDVLIVCFIAENHGSPSATTQYCKPVR